MALTRGTTSTGTFWGRRRRGNGCTAQASARITKTAERTSHGSRGAQPHPPHGSSARSEPARSRITPAPGRTPARGHRETPAGARPSRTALPSPASCTHGGAPSTGDVPPQSLGSLTEDTSLSYSKAFRRDPRIHQTPLSYPALQREG